MRDLQSALASAQPFDVVSTEKALRALAESRGLSAGKYIHPLRLALTGRGASPPIFDVVVALGRQRTLARLQQLIDRLPSLTA
jgi:glutamyl-tRNA synthetase